MPNLEKQSDLRGSSLDFDPDVVCSPQTGQGTGTGQGSGSGNGSHRYEGQGRGQQQQQQQRSQGGVYPPLNSSTVCGFNPRQSNNNNTNTSPSPSLSTFDGFRNKEKQHSDPNLSRREEEAHKFFQGGKTSFPVSNFTHPLTQNTRSGISSSSLNNNSNNNNNSSDNNTTNNFDTNSNGCTDNQSSEYFFRLNNSLSNFQRMQNYSNFQLLSKPPHPPSQRAIAVVLASIKVCIHMHV